MSFQTLNYSIDTRQVANICLNRPEVHNAMSLTLIQEMREVLADLSQKPEIRAVILTGTGQSFCAGADLGWMKQIAAQNREQRILEATELSNMLNDLDQLEKPVIGRINGPAYGGGIGLIACCDFAFAADSAKFSLTEVSLGLIPATISPFVIRRIGEPNSRRLMLNAHRFGAEEGVGFGLLADVCPKSELDDRIEQEIQKFLKCAPEAIAATKRLISGVKTPVSDEMRAFTVAQLADTWETVSAEEGIDAFFSKRKPNWHPENQGNK